MKLLFQDNKWDLSRALNSFFAAKCEQMEAAKVEENDVIEIKDEDDGVSVETALESGMLTTQVLTNQRQA